jgi:hypothetical protein
VTARGLSFWFDPSSIPSVLVIGDANWDTRIVPTDEDGRRVARIEIERRDGTLTVEVVTHDVEDDEFRVAALPAGWTLSCNATRTGEPLLSVIAPAEPATVFAVFETGGRELREFVGTFNATDEGA